MKKILFILLGILALSSVRLDAEEMSSQARRFKNSVKTFLIEEGYSVEESSSGSGWIFKKDGINYMITFSKENPVFVKILSLITSPGTKNSCDILSALNAMNAEYCCIKGTYDADENDVMLAIEAYYHSTEEFRYTFSQNMAVLSACHDKYDEFISNSTGGHSGSYTGSSASSAPVVFMSALVANCDVDNNIINDFGSSIFSYRTRYLEPKLTLKVNRANTYKIGVKLYTPDGNLSTGGSSTDGYSYVDTKSLATGTREVILSGWGKDVNGNWPAGDYRFEFYVDGKYIGSKAFTVK